MSLNPASCSLSVASRDFLLDINSASNRTFVAMDKSALAAQYKGTKIQELSTPCAILDLAKLEVNCQRMLDTVRRLDLGWRPHIKTHKVSAYHV